MLDPRLRDCGESRDFGALLCVCEEIGVKEFVYCSGILLDKGDFGVLGCFIVYGGNDFVH